MKRNVASIVLCSVDPARYPQEELGIQSISAQLNTHGLCTEVYYYKTNNYKELVPTPEVKILGFSVFSTNYQFVNQIISWIKHIRSDIVIVIGGHYASDNDNIFKLMPEVDYVINGEGEVTSLELFRRILDNDIDRLSEVEGIAFKKDNRIVRTMKRELICDLDALSFPDRPLLRAGVCQEAMLETARGCTGACSFCSVNQTKWRAKSISVVVNEIESIVRKYNVDVFSFTDSSFDNPFLNIERINDFADEIIRRKLNIKFMVYLKTKIYQAKNNEMWDKLRRAGLTTVLVGIESFNKSDLELFQKNANVKDNIECISMLSKLDFQLILGFINIHPYSTMETLKVNNEKLFELRLAHKLYQFNFLQMYPQTQICKMSIEDNLYVDRGYNLEEYEFIDPSVSKFAKYLKNNTFKNDAVKSIFTLITDLGRLEKFFYIIKRDAVYRENIGMCRIVENSMNEMKYLCSILDVLIYDYFNEYIEVFSKFICEEQAEMCTKSFVDKCQRLSLNKKLEIFRLSTIKRLLEYDKATTLKYLKIRQL